MENTMINYKELIDEIIEKQSIILGPDVAVMKARTVKGLEVSDTGRVIEVKGEGGTIARELIDAYVNLSGLIVKSALQSVFAKYPSLTESL